MCPMHETCQSAKRASCWNYDASRRVLELGCPYSGTTAGVPAMSNVRNSCASQSAGEAAIPILD